MMASPAFVLICGIAVALGLVLSLILLANASAGRGDFVIRLGPQGRVEVQGKIPSSKVPEIRAFFQEQPGGIPRGYVSGTFGPGGTPTLRFSRGINPILRQRARNFLIEHLR